MNTMKRPSIGSLVISIGLFALALAPRVVDLQAFVTAGEAKWVHRSTQLQARLESGARRPADQSSRERIGRETATYLERCFGATE